MDFQDDTEPAVIADTSMDLAAPLERGMRLILNGGKDSLDSATIRIRWDFDENVAALLPTHILVIVETKNDIGRNNRGERYSFLVSDGQGFLPFYAPGKHRITVFAFSDPAKRGPEFSLKQRVRSTSNTCSFLLRRDKDRDFSIAVSTDLACRLAKPTETKEEIPENIFCIGSMGNADKLWQEIVAITVMQADIPEGLFSEKPKSILGTWTWKWVNRWHTSPPRDQCAFRARAIWAFTAQPVLFVIGYLLRYVLAAVLTVLVPLLRVGCWFIGYRPEPLFNGIGTVWNPRVRLSDCLDGTDVRKFGKHATYRSWSSSKAKDVWLTPIEVTIVGLLIYFIITMIRNSEIKAHITSLTITALIVGVILAIIIVRVFRLLEERGMLSINRDTEKRLPAGDPNAAQFQEWLTARRKKAGIQEPFQKGAVVVFRTKFWELKKAICRPYRK